MTRADLDRYYPLASDKPFAHWLAFDSTRCPDCNGPRDSHVGCDCRRPSTTRRLINALYGEENYR
jgi:hypothetical protein